MNKIRDILNVLRDFFLDSMAFSHEYVLNRQIAEHIQANQYSRPLNRHKIREKLLGEHETEDVYSFLLFESSPNELEVIERYYQSMKIPEYVPDEPYTPLNFWVEPQEVTQKFDKFIIDRMKEGHYLLIEYIGEKGSGKSLTISCWLAKNNHILNQNNILWLYADGYKLYDIWKSQNANYDNLVTIDEFLKLRLVYIIAKYRRKSEFLNNIYNQLANSSRNVPIIGRSGLEIQKQHIKESLDDLERNIKSYEINRRHFDGIDSQYYTYLLRESQRRVVAFARAKARWLHLADEVEDWLLSNGYKILKIIDGIDNINIETSHTRPRELYTRAMEQAQDFMRKESRNTTKLLVIRERTLIDMNRLYPLPPDHPNRLNIIHVRQPPQNIKRIYSQRVLYIGSPGKKAPKIYNFLKLTDKYMESFYNNRLERRLFGDLYHNNVSNFLYNMLSLNLLLYYRWLQQGEPDLSEYNMEAQLDYYFPRNLFLNGRFFLDSQIAPPNMSKVGLYSFSPFYVNINYQRNNNISPLVFVTIVQLLDQELQLSEEDLEEILKDMGYNSNLIKEAIEKCRAYGLIDTLVDRHGRIYIETGNKGKYWIKLIFSNIDLLYMFALDTYIPSLLIDEGYIEAYNNKLLRDKVPVKTKYAVGAIKSATVFMAYILQIGAIRDRIIESTVQSPVFSLGRQISIPIDLNVVRLLTKRFVHLYKSASPEEKEEIENFVYSLSKK